MSPQVSFPSCNLFPLLTDKHLLSFVLITIVFIKMVLTTVHVNPALYKWSQEATGNTCLSQNSLRPQTARTYRKPRLGVSPSNCWHAPIRALQPLWTVAGTNELSFKTTCKTSSFLKKNPSLFFVLHTPPKAILICSSELQLLLFPNKSFAWSLCIFVSGRHLVLSFITQSPVLCTSLHLSSFSYYPLGFRSIVFNCN